MYELKVKNGRGEVLNLSSHPNYTVYKVTGLQPVAANISSSANATSDGITVNSVRAGERNIVIYLALNGDIEQSRINLYRYFPLKQTVTVYFKTASRDVFTEGYVQTIECDLFARKQIMQISLICPQSYFMAVDEIVSYFSEISNSFEFPFSIEESGVVVSEITSNVRKSIINTGDIESGLLISMYAAGTVVNPVIYDAFKRTQIKLNYTMQPEDQILINTNMGKKSITLIRGGVSYNILGYLAAGSSWLTLSSGDNVFTYSADEGVTNLRITFTSNVLYGGV